jgi:hypothetical protein
MTLQNLLEWATQDKIAVIFIFFIIPLLTMAMNRLFEGQGDESPYNYGYSILVYASATAGLLSGAVWLYSMLFEDKSLWELDPFVYYLPMISMIITLVLVKQNADLKKLPWFGELYELLAMIFITFWVILLIMKMEFFQFNNVWQIFLFFVLFFIGLKLAWERFQVIVMGKKR